MESGTRLGPYEVQEQLGAGGMGEVYLAFDSRLGRQVAVKVLPAEYAGDPERLARFEQEARAAATLSHANIAVVHDVGADNGVHYFVQEFLAGEELRDRLDRSPPDTAVAVDFAVQIARALEAAHRAGVVHRDLKPENVFVTEDGTLKVLDFGLAKLVESATGNTGTTAESPTQLGTSASVIMGTAGYMAPEQVQGGDIDGRTDIFAFGCVLYEMLTHSRPFHGESVIQTLNRIVHEEPRPVAELAAVSPELQRIVGKCLAKGPRQRYQTAADLVVDLEALAASPERLAPPAAVAAPAATARAGLGLPVVAALVAFALVAGIAGARFLAPGGDAPGRALQSDLVVTITPRNDPVTAVSPDGTKVAYLGEASPGVPGLYVRDLSTSEARLLEDTELAHTPFFSPDGSSLGYFDDTDRSLWTIALATGNRQRLSTTTSAHLGATWTSAGTLVFTGHEGGLGLVPESGGEVRMLATPGVDTLSYENPRPIPGTGDVFVTVKDSSSDVETRSLAIVDGTSGELTEILAAGSDARYVEPGYLLFRTRDGIAAVAFDLASRSVTGEPFAMVPGVAVTSDGSLEYDVSPNGVLIYLSSVDYPRYDDFRIVAVDRAGNATALPLPAAAYWGVRVSPDGTQLAVDLGAASFVRPFTVMVDIATGTQAVLGREQWYSAWSRAGDQLALTRMSPRGTFDVMLVAADLSGEERMLEGPEEGWTPQPVDFTPGDETLLVDGITTGVVWEVSTTGEGTPTRLDLPPIRRGTALSPDGRWLAFSSEDGGEQRVQVIERATGRRWSVGVGIFPRWAPRGSELLYWSADTLYAVPVTAGTDWSSGEPQALFSGSNYWVGDDERSSWDVSPDGETFYLVRDEGTPGWDPVRFHLVQNAGALVASIDPASRR